MIKNILIAFLLGCVTMNYAHAQSYNYVRLDPNDKRDLARAIIVAAFISGNYYYSKKNGDLKVDENFENTIYKSYNKIKAWYPFSIGVTACCVIGVFAMAVRTDGYLQEAKALKQQVIALNDKRNLELEKFRIAAQAEANKKQAAAAQSNEVTLQEIIEEQGHDIYCTCTSCVHLGSFK